MKIKLNDGSGTVDLKYIYEDVDRHGKVRIYYRRKGQRKVKLVSPPGTKEFLDEYRSAHTGLVPNQTLSSKRKNKPADRDTLRYIVEQYYISAEYRRLADSTQRVRRLILDAFCEEPLISGDPLSMTMGSARFSLMQPIHMRKCRDRRANTPEAANSLVKALRQVFK